MSYRVGLEHVVCGSVVCWCGLLLSACEDEQGDQAWPPVSLGGQARVLGPTEELQIDPVTSYYFENSAFCAAPIRALGAGERVELQGGDWVDVASLARWQGSVHCQLSADSRIPLSPGGRDHLTLQLGVRINDDASTTCEHVGGGMMIQSTANVSLHLTDAEGATLQQGSCSSAFVAAWGGATNLQLECLGLQIEVRAYSVQLRSPSGDSDFYDPQCERE